MTDANNALLRSFTRSLRNAHRSERTIQSYIESAGLLAAFRPGVDFDAMTRDDLEAFMGDYLAKHKPTSAAVRYRALRRFYNWMLAEEITHRLPDGEDEPTAGARAAGTDPAPRRDRRTARRSPPVRTSSPAATTPSSGCSSTPVSGSARWPGSPSRMSTWTFTTSCTSWVRAAVAGRSRSAPGPAPRLDRYLRERGKHKLAKLPNLWIGARGGPMTESGIAQMLRRRGAEAGVENLHPHRFRHTFAHLWKTAGGDGDRPDATHRLAVPGDAGPLRRLSGR